MTTVHTTPPRHLGPYTPAAAIIEPRRPPYRRVAHIRTDGSRFRFVLPPATDPVKR